MIERVWMMRRPGEHLVDANGDLVVERELPEDSPLPHLPMNKGKMYLVTREVAASEEPAQEVESALFGEDHED